MGERKGYGAIQGAGLREELSSDFRPYKDALILEKARKFSHDELEKGALAVEATT